MLNPFETHLFIYDEGAFAPKGPLESEFYSTADPDNQHSPQEVSHPDGQVREAGVELGCCSRLCCCRLLLLPRTKVPFNILTFAEIGHVRIITFV